MRGETVRVMRRRRRGDVSILVTAVTPSGSGRLPGVCGRVPKWQVGHPGWLAELGGHDARD